MPPLAQLPAAYVALEAQKAELEREVKVLRAQIEWLKRKLFGLGQSERIEREQLMLQLAELEKLQAGAAAPLPPKQVSYERVDTAPRPKRDGLQFSFKRRCSAVSGQCLALFAASFKRVVMDELKSSPFRVGDLQELDEQGRQNEGRTNGVRLCFIYIYCNLYLIVFADNG